MNNSRERYRATDLLIFALILGVLETVNRLALNVFPGEVFTLSVTLPVTLIVFMRWGAWGLLHAALGGLVYAIANGGTIVNILTYALGNLAAAFTLLLFQFPGRERIRTSAGLTALYAAVGYFSMNLGRAAISAVMTHLGFVGILIRFLSVESLSAVIACVILWIARRQDGVFEDQDQYLRRLASEEEAKKHA